MKMANEQLKYVVQGITLALIVYIASSSTVPLLFHDAYAQAPGLFSVTVIAPGGGNVARRQYASIITSNLISLGVDAKLFYVTFPALVNRLFFANAPQGSVFEKGGYDMGFVGWGYTSPVPDFRSNFDGRKEYLAPDGNNYALYNSAELNAVWDELYRTTDLAKQRTFVYKAQEIIFRDKPYNYVYSSLDIVARDQKWSAWGGKDVYSAVTFPDVQQWSGGNELTFAESSNVFPGQTLNPAQTSSSNSFYALYIYGAIMYAAAGLQDIDGRDLTFYPALATNIQTSANGLDWTITIRKGALWQSGVEITADDFVWTRWALLNPKTASTGLGNDVQYLGNVVDFKFLDNTTATLDNREKPTDKIERGSWTTVDRYTFKFHMPDIYAFTGQTYAAFSPLPKHILEKFKPETWDTIPYSTASGKATYTWDTAKYGGTGSYSAVGPVGAGPYYMDSFDFTRNLATMKKFKQFWNATGLERMGRFSVETFKVVWIGSKDAAIAALRNKEVDVLENNYQLARDVPTLTQMGANVLKRASLGWQEQGFNLKHPVFGTGVDTPLGKSNPSMAAEAARHVRKAVSHLIPREQIVTELLAGAAAPLATFVGPGWGALNNPTLKPDAFDLSMAASELRAAGYNPQLGPAPAKIALSGNPILGSGTVALGGTGRVAREMLLVQQSTDQQTWTTIAALVTGNNSKYELSVSAPPAFGTVYYRTNFTGYVVNETLAQRPLTPALVNQYIRTRATIDRRQLLPSSLEGPVASTSATNDALVVVVPIIVIIVAAALVFRMRKKKTAAPTTSPTT